MTIMDVRLVSMVWHVTLLLGLTGVVGCQETIDTRSTECPHLLHIIDDLTKSVDQLRTKIELVEGRQSDCRVYFTDHPSGILIQQHYTGTTFFDRTWNEFKVGFGDVSGNYWIGNDRLHELTQYGDYKLRVDLKAKNNSQWYWAEYSTFIVDDESTNYMLHIGGYNGTAEDSLKLVNERKFTTRDRDNDRDFNNCAVLSGGGFWYNSCFDAGLNSPAGMGVYSFGWRHLPTGSADWSDHKKLLVSRLILLPNLK